MKTDNIDLKRESHAIFKYLIPNDNDKKFKAIVNAVGLQYISPNSQYPLKVHPSDYYFDISNGRVLNEYQLIYITNGRGVFRSNHTPKEGVSVRSGSMIIVRPGERHSYYPIKSTGWTEYYIGFEGKTFETIIELIGLDKGNNICDVGLNEELQQLYKKALDTASNNGVGVMTLLSGIVCHIIGLTSFIMRNKTIHASHLEQSIEKAKILMDERVTESIDISHLASDLNMSYSWFRKIFKEHTGLSPAKYFQTIKIKRAQRMLLETSLSIKEISFKLGYKSSEHFFMLFKRHTGYTPVSYRNIRIK